jgi:hypothetical protein
METDQDALPVLPRFKASWLFCKRCFTIFMTIQSILPFLQAMLCLFYDDSKHLAFFASDALPVL